VGTARGLSFIPEEAAISGSTGAPRTMLSGTAVRGLAASGDTVWAATDAGLLAALPADTLPRRTTATDARLRRPLVAIARVDSLLIAATQDEVIFLVRGQVTASPRLDRGQLVGVGRILALAADGQSIWVAGDRGVAVVSRATGVSRVLPVPSNIPAPALDVMLDRDFVWIATTSGVVRLRRMPDGSVR
jgi:ligand-binding sensor domain-containing protein